MSEPPQSDWQAGQHPGPLPNDVSPANPSGYGVQQPPSGWLPGPWPPPRRTNGLKWLLIAVAVLLVIGISVGTTLLVTRGSGRGGSAAATSGVGTAEVASANDTGPVSIITDEPTCDAFMGINDAMADVQRNGWGDQRQTLGPTADWTAIQRSQVEAVATAMRNSAEQLAPLARRTPHRFVRKLYEQLIAYGRAYADSMKNYRSADNALASTHIEISGTLFGICNSIETGAANRSISVERAVTPTQRQHAIEPPNTQRFVSTSGETCADWKGTSDTFDLHTVQWQTLDTNTPAERWSAERLAVQRAAVPFISAWADELQSVGVQSGNPVVEDFAMAASLYLRAYASVGDTYLGSDSWLMYIAYRINHAVLAGCRAAVR